MRIETEVKLDFKDVLIRPKRSTLGTRSDVDISREFRFRHAGGEYAGIPIIAANMDSTGTFEMAKALDALPDVDRAAQALRGRRVRRVLHRPRAQERGVLLARASPSPTRTSSTG